MAACALEEEPPEGSSASAILGGVADKTIAAWATLIATDMELETLRAVPKLKLPKGIHCAGAVIAPRVVLTEASCIRKKASWMIFTLSAKGSWQRVTTDTSMIVGGAPDLGLLVVPGDANAFTKASYPKLVANPRLTDKGVPVKFSVVGRLLDGVDKSAPIVKADVEYTSPTVLGFSATRFIQAKTVVAEKRDVGGFVRDPTGRIAGAVSRIFVDGLARKQTYQLDAILTSEGCRFVNQALTCYGELPQDDLRCTDEKPKDWAAAAWAEVALDEVAQAEKAEGGEATEGAEEIDCEATDAPECAALAEILLHAENLDPPSDGAL